MASYPHLPLATEFSDREALVDLRDRDLCRMRDECRLWSVGIEAFRACLVTPAALVIWRVLIVEETLLVASAQQRVIDEMSERRSRSAKYGEPAPGEDLAHMIGSTEAAEPTQVRNSRNRDK